MAFLLGLALAPLAVYWLMSAALWAFKVFLSSVWSVMHALDFLKPEDDPDPPIFLWFLSDKPETPTYESVPMIIIVCAYAICHCWDLL